MPHQVSPRLLKFCPYCASDRVEHIGNGCMKCGDCAQSYAVITTLGRLRGTATQNPSRKNKRG